MKYKIPFVNLRKQYRHIKKDIDRAIRAVLTEGQFVLGKNVEKFEKEFARYCGAKYAVGVASGTEALEMALRVLGVGQGDEVITAPNSAVATAMAILATGAKPVFIDIEPDSYNINPDLIEKKISKKTKVILPVHLFGSPAKINKILVIAKKHKLEVIEDACQAHGAKYQGKKVGTFGRIGCFSFYQTKNLGAYGDGGMVVTNDDKIYKLLLKLRNYGWNKRRESVSFGINSRLDELQAAILRAKLPYLDKWNKKRRVLAKLYHQLLKNTPLQLPQETENGFHVYHLYVAQSPLRNQLMKFLEKKGIVTMIHYPILIPHQHYFKKLGYKKGDYSVTEKINPRIISLPLYPEMEKKDVREVCRAILKFFK